MAKTPRVGTYPDERDCTPARSTTGQVKKVVIQYMDQNPQILHASAFMVVQNALIDAFDCDTDYRYPL